jgi:hypothetical protein
VDPLETKSISFRIVPNQVSACISVIVLLLAQKTARYLELNYVYSLGLHVSSMKYEVS